MYFSDLPEDIQDRFIMDLGIRERNVRKSIHDFPYLTNQRPHVVSMVTEAMNARLHAFRATVGQIRCDHNMALNRFSVTCRKCGFAVALSHSNYKSDGHGGVVSYTPVNKPRKKKSGYTYGYLEASSEPMWRMHNPCAEIVINNLCEEIVPPGGDNVYPRAT